MHRNTSECQDEIENGTLHSSQITVHKSEMTAGFFLSLPQVNSNFKLETVNQRTRLTSLFRIKVATHCFPLKEIYCLLGSSGERSFVEIARRLWAIAATTATTTSIKNGASAMLG